MQEGVHALVCLHAIDDRAQSAARLAAASSGGWPGALTTGPRCSTANGAYDEAYPFEQCLAATAFTSFYLGAAFARRRSWLDAALSARVERTLRRAADWLCAHDETHGLLSNHLGVAVAALEQSARLFGEPRYAERARFFLERIFRHQSAEGWMREYDGADIGYGTHGFFYLAVVLEDDRAASGRGRRSIGSRSFCRTSSTRTARLAVSTAAATPSSTIRPGSRCWRTSRRPARRLPRRCAARCAIARCAASGAWTTST